MLLQLRDGKELRKVGEHTAWESLRFAIEMIQQIRNIGTSVRDSDFLLSPVRDALGKHFDSREWLDDNDGKETPNNLKLPLSGDANGAYNIARK